MITKFRSGAYVAVVNFDNGDILYMGYTRPAFPSKLVKANGEAYYIQGLAWPGNAGQGDRQPVMITDDVRKSFGQNWAYWGTVQTPTGLKVAITGPDIPNHDRETTQVNGNYPITAYLYECQDASVINNEIINYTGDLEYYGMATPEDDAISDEVKAVGLAVC